MSELPVVVVLGAGMGGRGVVAALSGSAHLVVVDRDQAFADRAAALADSAEAVVVDLTDLSAVEAFCAELLARHGRVDAVVHLVGGWAGSTTVDAQAITQFQQLLPGILTTVQTTSVAFRDALLAAPAGRYLMVTSAAARTPKQNVAAYTALKGAAERWVEALGDSFTGSPARAVILAVIALVDDAMRQANPDKTYATFTDVADLGAAVREQLTGTPEQGAYIDLSRH